jgi:hypothetical protein
MMGALPGWKLVGGIAQNKAIWSRLDPDAQIEKTADIRRSIVQGLTSVVTAGQSARWAAHISSVGH